MWEDGEDTGKVVGPKDGGSWWGRGLLLEPGTSGSEQDLQEVVVCK